MTSVKWTSARLLRRRSDRSPVRGSQDIHVDSTAGDTEPVALTGFRPSSRQLFFLVATNLGRAEEIAQRRPLRGCRWFAPTIEERNSMTAVASEALTAEQMIKIAREQVDAFNGG